MKKRLSTEHKEKISKALTGRVRSIEERKSISDGMKGKKMSESHLKSLRIAAISRRMSEEERATALRSKALYRKNYRQTVGKTREYKDKRNERLAEKYRNDIDYRIAVLLRSRVHKAIKRKSSTLALKYLGCSLKEFQFYLEGKFQDGMSWDNWSYVGWHIDHIIPLAYFDLADDEQMRKAYHYTNLQPLWARENILKSNKVVI